MGILDRLSSIMGGGKKKGGIGDLVRTLVNEFDGVEGLIAKLREAGLSEQVDSWIGNGANAPISPERVTDALGSDTVADVADEMGVGFDQAAQRLSMALPRLIDRVTPEGKVPEGGLDLGKISDLLGGGSDR